MRRLRPIELAEGALLADIAVVFQLLVMYLPIGGEFFRVLIFVVFAVLALRRDLYVGMMGMSVAVFLITVLTGPFSAALMLLQCTGGLFLGWTMKRRMHHLLLLLIGITCGGVAFYGLTLLSILILGTPISLLISSLREASDAAQSLLGSILGAFGLQGWWKQFLQPVLVAVSRWAFVYWWAALYLLLCLMLSPIVSIIYATTNFFVRWLGYDVRPLLEGRPARIVRRGVDLLIKAILKQRAAKRR